ncbi:MAG: hypothetical protein AAGB24_09420 [Bacteroidota bacterium]
MLFKLLNEGFIASAVLSIFKAGAMHLKVLDLNTMQQDDNEQGPPNT